MKKGKEPFTMKILKVVMIVKKCVSLSREGWGPAVALA